MSKDVVLVPLLVFSLWLSTDVASESRTGDGSECRRQCGSVAVPYPFGISNMSSTPVNGNCLRGSPFKLICNISYQPPKLFWGGIEVSSISLETGELTIAALMNYECVNSSVSMARDNTSGGFINLADNWSFAFSQRNIFISLGCDITSTLRGYWGRNAVSSCTALCSNDTGFMEDGNCDGFGCCQFPISKGVKRYTTEVRRNSDDWYKYSRCGFGFLVDRAKFVFKKAYLTNYSFYVERNASMPVVLDWAIDNMTCDAAASSPNYACKGDNAMCINSTLQPGYLCACKEGFEGNPYQICTGSTKQSELMQRCWKMAFGGENTDKRLSRVIHIPEVIIDARMKSAMRESMWREQQMIQELLSPPTKESTTMKSNVNTGASNFDSHLPSKFKA